MLVGADGKTPLSVSALTRWMASKRMRPSKNASTAISFAAFSTAVLPLPRRMASQAKGRPGKRSLSASSKVMACMALKLSAAAPEAMRCGHDRPKAIGTRISGVPNCATTELSWYCTMLWMMDCG